MPNNRSIRIAAIFCAATLMSVGTALAYEEKAFTDAQFKAAQQAGKPILVDAYASWCPVCRAQQTVLDKLKQNGKYDALTVFKIDYDNQPDALKSFNVQRQSTLIAYKGEKETGRSVGDTNAASIEALLDSALK